MPAPSPPAANGNLWRSASAIVAGAVSGYHVLKIVGYSRTKDVPNGDSINSRQFLVGGRKWHVEYKPNGDTGESFDFISLYLYLDDTVPEAVKAMGKFSLLDQDGKPVPSYSKTTDFVNFSGKKNWGFAKFINSEVLEKSEHLKDDSFTVRIDVTVMKDVHTQDTPMVVVPPSDMHRHFGDLLLSKEGTDVKFRVRGKTFSAHRSVLAARSPVFKKALFGPMKEGSATNAIPIDDMEAKVFGALLTFMYTDELPDFEEEEESAMAQHLLVAADKYNLERLKLICEDKLCNHIDTGSATTILALAEQHNCCGLKQACFDFLSTSAALNTVMETDGFEYLTKNCPNILKELVSKAPPCRDPHPIPLRWRQRSPRFIKREDLERSEHLRDDSFTVRFDVTIMNNVQIVEKPFVVVPLPPSDMHQHYLHFGDILLSKEGADVRFHVGRKTFAAHRLVLSARSPVFKAELYGPMKESATKDAKGIKDMKPEVFDALLTFM
ncbi:hypothetical protein U9M48_009233 [Paspalum notatum var. saurae]|uniref:Uncharacterized protein n=1 Tax=Paspalum notatum var. saurae TaxID=547442 RepID=A0AAQ3WER0_PASNO